VEQSVGRRTASSRQITRNFSQVFLPYLRYREIVMGDNYGIQARRDTSSLCGPATRLDEAWPLTPEHLSPTKASRWPRWCRPASTTSGPWSARPDRWNAPSLRYSPCETDIDNPTLTAHESAAKGGWFYATLPSGMFGFLLSIEIILTSLPLVRRRSYNTFSYTHIICSVLIFIATFVHANTDFYFLLPGHLLWIIDMWWRAFRGDSGMWKSVTGKLENVGSGWYRIILPVAANSALGEGALAAEKLPSTVQSYNLNIPQISELQNHAFTAAKTGVAQRGPVFLSPIRDCAARGMAAPWVHRCLTREHIIAASR